MDTGRPLSHAEFWDIYRKVPRLTVELVFIEDGQVLLTKRAEEPCRGFWHLPGGTVRFGEPLAAAVRRISQSELALTAGDIEFVGFIEYPSHYLNGSDHPVGLAFRVTRWTGQVRLSSAATDQGWFSALPAPMHDEQREFLQSLGVHSPSHSPGE